MNIKWLTRSATDVRCQSRLGVRYPALRQSVGQPRRPRPAKCCRSVVSRSAAMLLGYKRSANRREEFQVEEWTYGPSNGMYQYLRFEGNRLRQINSKRGN